MLSDQSLGCSQMLFGLFKTCDTADMISFFNCRYSDVADRQKMLWDAKYQTLSKQLNITEQQEKKIKGNLPVKILSIWDR